MPDIVVVVVAVVAVVVAGVTGFVDSAGPESSDDFEGSEESEGYEHSLAAVIDVGGFGVSMLPNVSKSEERRGGKKKE